jgi:hypothetical protein
MYGSCSATDDRAGVFDGMLHGGFPGNGTPARTSPNGARQESAMCCSLRLQDGLESVPSIGRKTAERFHELGIRTVEQFLASDAREMAARLANRRLSQKVLSGWQDQARLMCQIPELHGHEAHLLAAAGIRSAADLVSLAPRELMARVERALATRDGERIIRGNAAPDLQRIRRWIENASRAPSLQSV